MGALKRGGCESFECRGVDKPAVPFQGNCGFLPGFFDVIGLRDQCGYPIFFKRRGVFNFIDCPLYALNLFLYSS